MPNEKPEEANADDASTEDAIQSWLMNQAKQTQQLSEKVCIP